MNPKIISSLRNRSKLTKRYYSNPTEKNQNLTAKSNECPKMIDKAKKRYTNKLGKKLDNPSTMPKAYLSILNTFLNNKKIPNIPPLNVKLFLTSRKKRNSSIHTLPLTVLQLTIQVYFHH